MAAKVARASKDVAMPSRSLKLQTPALNVRVVKRSAGKRSMGGKR